MLFHDGQMYGIARRQLPMSKNNLLCALCSGAINGQHLVDNAEQGTEFDWIPLVIFTWAEFAYQKHKPVKLLRKLGLAYLGAIAFFAFMILPEAHSSWQVVAEGVYDHSTYAVDREKKVPVGWRDLPYLVIYFDDGRTFTLRQMTSMPFIKGTRIKILEANGDLHKIEKE